MEIEYDIMQPWNTLDPWQKEYIEAPHDQNCFVLSGRQCGKTTAMSIKCVELCMKKFKKGEFILICSVTEKQAYHMLAKALAYAETKYPKEIMKGLNKPTMHKLNFKNGTGVLCYAAGETGEGLRGFTIKKLMIDEGARMNEEFFISAIPMISVVNGSTDIGSTPAGKLWKDGTEKFFYKCSKDDSFKKFYVSAEECPRHSKDFLKIQKEKMSKLAYAQEYLGIFTDELQRLFSEEWIKKCAVSVRRKSMERGDYFLGADIAGFGGDIITLEVFEKKNNKYFQVENIMKKRQYTTETSGDIVALNRTYNIKSNGIDDGGLGFGVFSELMNNDVTRRKTVALNNSSRPIDREGKKSKKILKEEMYTNMLVLGEQEKLNLLNDDELIDSLRTIQHDEGIIYGSNSHVCEGIIRALWVGEKTKSLNIYVYY